MSDAPERIWTLEDPTKTWQDNPPDDGQMEWQWTEYARVDLSPQWMDIETAPKDGTSILLLREGQAVAGFWTNKTYADDIYHWVFLNEANPNAKFGIDGMIELNAFNALRGPTHWKPISE